jgi:hypothetical protein
MRLLHTTTISLSLASQFYIITTEIKDMITSRDGRREMQTKYWTEIQTVHLDINTR